MKVINTLFLTSMLLLSGCVTSKDLSPPDSSKTINISVIKPVDVDISPMDVIYRSEKCRDKIFTSSGDLTTRAGYHLLIVPFKKDSTKNIVSSNIALDGGGQCKWKISNVRFQFKFNNMKKFGVDVGKSIPSDIVFMFDDNPPPRGDGHKENVNGEVLITRNYYAMINKKFTEDGHGVLHIAGQPLLTYRVYDVESITFKPNVHSDLIVNVLTPNGTGDDYVILYPNGYKVIDPYFPNSKKTSFDFVNDKSK